MHCSNSCPKYVRLSPFDLTTALGIILQDKLAVNRTVGIVTDSLWGTTVGLQHFLQIQWLPLSLKLRYRAPVLDLNACGSRLRMKSGSSSSGRKRECDRIRCSTTLPVSCWSFPFSGSLDTHRRHCFCARVNSRSGRLFSRTNCRTLGMTSTHSSRFPNTFNGLHRLHGETGTKTRT